MKSTILSVNFVFVGALGTHVKDRLSFISRTQLHRVESHLRIITLGTAFLDLKGNKLDLWMLNDGMVGSYLGTGTGFGD